MISDLCSAKFFSENNAASKVTGVMEFHQKDTSQNGSNL